jgi:hypothetical protein
MYNSREKSIEKPKKIGKKENTGYTYRNYFLFCQTGVIFCYLHFAKREIYMYIFLK